MVWVLVERLISVKWGATATTALPVRAGLVVVAGARHFTDMKRPEQNSYSVVQYSDISVTGSDIHDWSGHHRNYHLVKFWLQINPLERFNKNISLKIL